MHYNYNKANKQQGCVRSLIVRIIFTISVIALNVMQVKIKKQTSRSWSTENITRADYQSECIFPQTGCYPIQLNHFI